MRPGEKLADVEMPISRRGWFCGSPPGAARMRRCPLVGEPLCMGTELALTTAIAAAALGAAWLADLLPRATTAALLRRRAGRLQLLVTGLVAVLATIGMAGLLGYGDLVPAV